MPEYFAVPMAVAASNCLAVVPERFARLVAARMPLRLLSPLLELPVPCVVQLWHERTHADPGCRWLRDLVQEAAAPEGGGRAAGEAGW